MISQTVSLNLAAVEVPKPQWQQHLKWVEWGAGHSFMKKVLDLIKGSPTASAMLRKKAQFVAGEGFVCDEKAYPGLAAFLKKVSDKGKYRTATQLLKRTSPDKEQLFAFAYQIQWNKGQEPKIIGVRHQRIETVASGPLNEYGEVETYWLCRDWSQQSKYPPKPIPAFNPENASRDGVQLLVWFKEGPGIEYYPELAFEPALNDMNAEGRLGRYRDNSIRTKFGANTVVAFREGPTDKPNPADPTKTITAKEQRDALTKDFNNQFTGDEANGIIYVFGDGTAEGAEKLVKIQPLSTATPETYEKIAEQCEEAIMKVGGVTSPVVIGLPSTGGLGSNGTEIEKAYEMFFNAECRPSQLEILEVWYDKILPYALGVEPNLPGITADEPALDIVTNLPVKFMFSEATLELILTDDELRAMIGYKPLPAGMQPAATKPAEDATAPAGEGSAGA